MGERADSSLTRWPHVIKFPKIAAPLWCCTILNFNFVYGLEVYTVSKYTVSKFYTFSKYTSKPYKNFETVYFENKKLRKQDCPSIQNDGQQF